MIYIREAVAGLISPWVVLSPPRFSRQLQQFAHTELYTHYDIAAMAARQESPLREEMLLHANDELRHHAFFLDWAGKVSPYVSANYSDSSAQAHLDREHVRALVGQQAAPHRRMPDLFGYMTYIFLSESRAVLMFKLYQWVNGYDARCATQIPRLLVDEKRHVRYSRRVAWAEFRKAPWPCTRRLFAVLGYILRQDLIDLLKLLQIIGSSVFTALLYYGIVTPYAAIKRCVGGVRRGRLRKARPTGQVPLDDAFWSRS